MTTTSEMECEMETTEATLFQKFFRGNDGWEYKMTVEPRGRYFLLRVFRAIGEDGKIVSWDVLGEGLSATEQEASFEAGVEYAKRAL